MPDRIGVGSCGKPVGQYHPRAKLSDADALKLLELRDRLGHGYRTLARMFGISPSQARNIVKGRSRLVPVEWRAGV